MKLRIYQIDAFTKTLFGGNPAAVCVLDRWITEDKMQKIAMENNLSETAFLVKKEEKYEIRWFAPQVEIALCGHATLASAYVLYNYYKHTDSKIHFYSHLSGDLFATRKSDKITLDFPEKKFEACLAPVNLCEALKVNPINIVSDGTDYLIEVEDAQTVLNCTPNFNMLAKVEARGIIITSKAKDVDFVSRFFAPKIGINEDPVTGSAHCLLSPYWSVNSGKMNFKAKQLSKRGGYLELELKKGRVMISGHAVCFLIGEINI